MKEGNEMAGESQASLRRRRCGIGYVPTGVYGVLGMAIVEEEQASEDVIILGRGTGKRTLAR